MNRMIDGYCRVLDALIALLLAAMVVLVFGNVVLRYGFNSGITVSEEMSAYNAKSVASMNPKTNPAAR